MGSRRPTRLVELTRDQRREAGVDVGVIAQDVQKVFPQLVRQDKQYLRVDYEKLVGPLIESVREMDARIKQLEATQKAH